MIRNISLLFLASTLFFSPIMTAFDLEDVLMPDELNEFNKYNKRASKKGSFKQDGKTTSNKKSLEQEIRDKVTLIEKKQQEALNKILSDKKKIFDQDKLEQEVLKKAVDTKTSPDIKTSANDVGNETASNIITDVQNKLDQDVSNKIADIKIDQIVETASNIKSFDRDIENKKALVVDQLKKNSQLQYKLNPGEYPQEVISVPQIENEKVLAEYEKLRKNAQNCFRWQMAGTIAGVAGTGIGVIGSFLWPNFNVKDIPVGCIGAGISVVAAIIFGYKASNNYSYLNNNPAAETEQQEKKVVSKMLDSELIELKKQADKLKKQIEDKQKK